MNSIVITNKKVFVNIEGKMKETTDPTLIGYAILDVADTIEFDEIIEIKPNRKPTNIEV